MRISRTGFLCSYWFRLLLEHYLVELDVLVVPIMSCFLFVLVAIALICQNCFLTDEVVRVCINTAGVYSTMLL